ncbi:MFS transporter [Collibacillus ludicampi]|uniref:MFS transporter n=1 Tax=Collibacillus ludicampi TaxID=2771369 RepID=A0AAV4LCG6_9BACL|nr:MFS transporter [Collibacillus ludicampi]GIM45458.1 MFS transporter [Collibacillus ludicampi]
MKRLIAIILSIGIAGLSQGLVIPLLAFLLERRGVNELINGLSTTSLFLAVLAASPFIEPAIRKYGAKRVIQGGAVLSILSVLAFPLFDHLYAWIFFRFLMGIGLSALYVATEVWINRIVEASRRGRIFAMYGLSIGIGMAIGPQGINLLSYGVWVPFILSAILFAIPVILLQFVPEEPFEIVEGNKRYSWRAIILMAPFALSTSFVYGFIEGGLAGDFPIYALRKGASAEELSLALTFFTLGSTVLQIPLGFLSDRYSRGKTLMVTCVFGALGFALLSFIESSGMLFLWILGYTGGVIGSLYSLGLAYVGDSITSEHLPTANVLYTANYGVGSILGPSVGALMIQVWGPDAFPWLLAGLLGIYVIFGVITRVYPSFGKHDDPITG